MGSALWKVVFPVMGLFLTMTACAYRPVGRLPLTRTFALVPFTNGTFKPGLQATLHSAVLDELGRDPAVRLEAPETADTLLEGTIAGYTNDGVGFDEQDIARRFRVQIRFRLIIRDRQSKTVLLMEDLVGEALYTAGPSVTTTKAAEADALQQAALDVARQVRFWVNRRL